MFVLVPLLLKSLTILHWSLPDCYCLASFSYHILLVFSFYFIHLLVLSQFIDLSLILLLMSYYILLVFTLLLLLTYLITVSWFLLHYCCLLVQLHSVGLYLTIAAFVCYHTEKTNGIVTSCLSPFRAMLSWWLIAVTSHIPTLTGIIKYEDESYKINGVFWALFSTNSHTH